MANVIGHEPPYFKIHTSMLEEEPEREAIIIWLCVPHILTLSICVYTYSIIAIVNMGPVYI